ncbi:MAG: heparinase II/III family protein, partial [Clostridia bacterium]
MKRILNFLLACLLILPVLPQMTVSAHEALDISETEVLYSEFDYSDPNWISDEDFFGVWNSEKLAWEEGKEPYFDYEKYDALAEVEKAAKQGRYDEARELVTKYYKEKFQNQPRTIKMAKDQDTILRAKLQAFNAFYLGGATLLDVIEFTSAPREIMADVTVIAQAVAADSLKTRTFEICAIEKDGYTAQIDSRESENQPYVKAEVNGVEKHFPVIRDTYLRGGSYESVNYGTEPILYVAENPDYTNAGKPPIYTVLPDAPEDPDYSETKRARLTVDFGDAIGGTDHDGLINGDIITSAKLCINGSTDKTDGTKKAIVFMNTGGDSEAESGAASKWTWKKANRVYASFSGEAGPIVNKGNFDQTQLHPFENYTALSQVYRYTGDEIYAYHAFRLYNNYIRAYGHRGQSHYMLDLGTRAADLPMILAQLSTSVHFNADNFVPMLKYAWTMGQGLVYGWDSQAQSGNWGLYETAGLAALAINFKEFDIVDDEMVEGGSFGAGNSGGWNKLIKHRYDVLAENILHEDGSFKETLGYAKESLTQYLNYVSFSEEAGEPYEFGEKVMEIFTKLGRYMMVATGPNFVDFQLGDSYGYKTSFRQRIKELADLTNDPLLTWAGTNGKYGTQPDFTSVLYPFRRQALLKTGWSMEDIYIDFSSDQTVSTHNHPDDLNVVMFANGQYLLTDQKQFSYTVNEPERVWVYSTQAHNTLAVPNVTHKADISAIYSGPQQAINGEYIYYNREQEASPGTIHRNENNSGYDFV